MDLQNDFLIGRRLDFVWHIWPRNLLPVSLRNESEEKNGLKKY
jgi:hypothetical protein